jgi:hypothetical protein
MKKENKLETSVSQFLETIHVEIKSWRMKY